MSIKGVIQFAICIESYYILQYPQQGLFSFDINIYQQQNERKISAIPYQAYNQFKVNNQTNRFYQQPHIQDQTIISSLGFAKYSDELIKMNDWMRFRLQIQAYPMMESDNIYMSLDLKLNHKKIQEISNEGEVMETVILRINDIENGNFNYCEAQFSSPYSSKLNFFIYTHLTTFKFAKYQPTTKELQSLQKQRLKVKSIQQLVEVSKSFYPNQNVHKILYVNLIKKLRITQYLMAQRISKYQKEKTNFAIHLDKEFMKNKNQEEISQKDFKEYLDHFFPQNLDISLILELLNEIMQQNFNFIENVLVKWKNGELKLDECRKEFSIFERQKYGERVFKTIIQGKQQIQTKKQVSYRQNKKIAKQVREKNIVMNNYPLQNIKELKQKDQQQIIFYQLTIPYANETQKAASLILSQENTAIFERGNKLQYSQKHMLVVMCHGFQGSSYDMQLIKKWILQQLPDAYYMVSKYNEDNTQGDINEMGKKLSQEIENYVSNYMEEYEQENVIINLIGHSMGGIIARAALPYLQKYQSQMGFYCSLSSPHLGYLNGVSGLIKVGLWAIRRWKKIQSLEQLSMQEQKNPRKTFLYDLSKRGHLKYFRKIILISSFEDSYVSWHSARISSHKSKNSLSKIQHQMESNILGDNIYGATVHRLDINFNVKTNTLDSFIGRTAHINLIIKENFFKTIYLTIPKLFDLVQFQRKGLFL